MEAGLTLLEPKRGQALVCIRARLSGPRLKQQKRSFSIDIYSGAQAVGESVSAACDYPAATRNVKQKEQSSVLHLGLSNPTVAREPLRVLSVSKCLKSF